MWSAVLVGAVVVIISGSSMVYAQQREGEGERGQNPGFSAEDRTPAIDARIAFRLTLLKERLRLTPEQAKNWPAYEAAFQAVAKLRRERMEAGPDLLQTRCNECGSALRYSALWVPRCRASRMRRGLSTTALTKIRSANLRRSRRCLVIKATCINARCVMTTVVVGAIGMMTIVAVGAVGTMMTVAVGAIGTMATVAVGAIGMITIVAVGAVGTTMTVAVGAIGTMATVAVGAAGMMTIVAVGAIGTMRTVAVGVTGTTAIVVVGAAAAIAATGTTMVIAAVNSARVMSNVHRLLAQRRFRAN